MFSGGMIEAYQCSTSLVSFLELRYESSESMQNISSLVKPVAIHYLPTLYASCLIVFKYETSPIYCTIQMQGEDPG